MKLIIKRIEDYWTVNGKRFADLSNIEKDILTKFIKSYDDRNKPN